MTDLSLSERARVRNREIGFIFQSFNLIGDLTVYENVELPLTYRGMRSAERKTRVTEALERVGMAHRAKHLPSQLSGGQQQRVAVARAVCGEPSILLADEPTGNLDSKNGEAVMDLLARAAQGRRHDLHGHARRPLRAGTPSARSTCSTAASSRSRSRCRSILRSFGSFGFSSFRVHQALMRQDLIYAARLLLRTPLFTLAAALSLGIGIAGNAAVFSLTDAALLRPRAGVAAPDRLAAVGRTQHGEGFDTFSYPTYRDYRERSSDVFDGLAAYREGVTFGLRAGAGTAGRVSGGQVSANYFDVLGVRMALGRGFAPAEELATAPTTVMVISHDLWQREFAGDRGVIGRTVRLNDRTFTIIGVAAPGFGGHTFAQERLWVLLTAYPEGDDLSRLSNRGSMWLLGVGRLKPGITVAQAETRMRTVEAAPDREYPDTLGEWGVAVAQASVLPQTERSERSTTAH